MGFQATKWIEVDAAHRVALHGSKCRNVHGHRYRVEATVEGPLHPTGSEAGMVADFGHIKTRLLEVVDAKVDHALMLWVADPLATQLVPANDLELAKRALSSGEPDVWVMVANVGKVVLLPCHPTAEELARHWFAQLVVRLSHDYGGSLRLVRVTVHETPSSVASYAG